MNPIHKINENRLAISVRSELLARELTYLIDSIFHKSIEDVIEEFYYLKDHYISKKEVDEKIKYLENKNAELRESVYELAQIILESAPLHWVATHNMEEVHEWEKKAAACLNKKVDSNICPSCNNSTDNGHDRCYPPNPYLCSKCEIKQEGE